VFVICFNLIVIHTYYILLQSALRCGFRIKSSRYSDTAGTFSTRIGIKNAARIFLQQVGRCILEKHMIGAFRIFPDQGDDKIGQPIRPVNGCQPVDGMRNRFDFQFF